MPGEYISCNSLTLFVSRATEKNSEIARNLEDEMDEQMQLLESKIREEVKSFLNIYVFHFSVSEVKTIRCASLLILFLWGQQTIENWQKFVQILSPSVSFYQHHFILLSRYQLHWKELSQFTWWFNISVSTTSGFVLMPCCQVFKYFLQKTVILIIFVPLYPKVRSKS